MTAKRRLAEARRIFKQLLADGVKCGEIEPCPINVLI
jgi:hypothetical protein